MIDMARGRVGVALVLFGVLFIDGLGAPLDGDEGRPEIRGRAANPLIGSFWRGPFCAVVRE